MDKIEFTRLLERSAITEQKPLHAVLLTVFETAQEARQAVTVGARGLSPQGEAELIARVTEAAGEGAQHEVERLAVRIGWRHVLKLITVGIALVCGGYLTGYWNGTARPDGDASFLAQLARSNDMAAIERYCRAHSSQQGDGTVCQMPSVWVRR